MNLAYNIILSLHTETPEAVKASGVFSLFDVPY